VLQPKKQKLATTKLKQKAMATLLPSPSTLKQNKEKKVCYHKESDNSSGVTFFVVVKPK
jgi:hypothetical protein